MNKKFGIDPNAGCKVDAIGEAIISDESLQAIREIVREESNPKKDLSNIRDDLLNALAATIDYREDHRESLIMLGKVIGEILNYLEDK